MFLFNRCLFREIHPVPKRSVDSVTGKLASRPNFFGCLLRQAGETVEIFYPRFTGGAVQGPLESVVPTKEDLIL